MRTYEQTHPWISFRFNPRDLPYPVWILLGEASMACTTLRQLALPTPEAALVNHVARLRGVVANASLDGNTLGTEQVDRLLEGSLHLPPSQLFLEREVRNLLKAVEWTEARTKAGDLDTGPWALQVLHAQLMKELPAGSAAQPGEFRTVRDGRHHTGVAPEEIPGLLDRLGAWTSGALFEPHHGEERLPLAILRAAITHLYLLWAAPFAEGNGRTARMVEFQLLLNAGIPAAAAHCMSIHAAATNGEYHRQVAQAATPTGDVSPFLAYLARGFAEGVKDLVAKVVGAQHRILAEDGLRHRVDPDGSPARERLWRLAKALTGAHGTVPTAHVARLTPDLAHDYARLNPKTLQRDLAQLEALGVVVRNRGRVRARPQELLPFTTGT